MSFEGKWLPDSNKFRQECLRISKDLEGFKTKNSEYFGYIGNDTRSYTVAKAFYDYLLLNDVPLSAIKLTSKNDIIGTPVLHEIDGNKYSAGSLRFLKVYNDCKSFGHGFSKGIFSSVIEIGSGYGGQCLIWKLFDSVKYTLIDIPESLEVAKSYLGNNKVKATFVTSNEVKGNSLNADLVISDYCLGELDEEGVEFYFNNVIQYCKYGYFTINNDSNKINFISKLLSSMFDDVRIESEEPKTSRHENLIIYASS